MRKFFRPIRVNWMPIKCRYGNFPKEVCCVLFFFMLGKCTIDFYMINKATGTIFLLNKKYVKFGPGSKCKILFVRIIYSPYILCFYLSKYYYRIKHKITRLFINSDNDLPF